MVELVVAMAILTISLTIAAFSFKDFLWSSQVTTAANEFAAALNYARSEAVTRGASVTVCRSDNAFQADTPGTPVPSCTTAAGSGWEVGYIAFVDANNNGTRDAGEDLLRVFAAQRGWVTLVGSNDLVNRVRFAASGFLGTGLGDVTASNAQGTRTVNIAVAPSGRVRTQ